MNTKKQSFKTTKRTDPELKQRGFLIFEAIGRFSVKFRWLVVLVWILGTVFVVHNFPSLSSVTQSDNSAFLPNSSPTEKAIKLATVFGSTNDTPVTIVVARAGSPLTTDDQQAIAMISTAVGKVSGVKKVENRGISADQEATQVVALAGSFTAD
jgi:RND superfamily putative drug exporter